MFDAIDTYVNQCISLTAEELEIFHSLLEHKVIKKKNLLLKSGDICNFEAFILKGCVRTYYVDESGKEVDLHFAIENWWISDLPSFTFRKPATLNIQTLEDCELLSISYEAKEKLFLDVPKFERMFRLLIQRTHEEMMNRFISTVSRTAEERYETFLRKYPTIPLRVPQHLIAAYLGISPEFLSKIRSRNNGR